MWPVGHQLAIACLERPWSSGSLLLFFLFFLYLTLVLLEKAMATHFSILAWRIHGQRSLVGYSPWGRKELDTTERLHFPYAIKAFTSLSLLCHLSLLSFVSLIMSLPNKQRHHLLCLLLDFHQSVHLS